MKYPCLVPKRLCKTDISLTFDREGLNEYGEPLQTIEYSGKCNYQDKAKTVLTADKKLIQITGTALFPGDICREAARQCHAACSLFPLKGRNGDNKRERGSLIWKETR